MVAPFFVLFGIFGLFPLLYTAWVSAHDWSLLAGDQGWLGLGNYSELMQDKDFWNAMLNTFGMFVVATVPQLVLAMVLAQMLNSRLRAATAWRMGILLPNVTSVAAVGIIFTMMFSRDFGLFNWILGHVGVDPIAWQDHRWSSWLAISTMVDWRWTGYNALIFLAAIAVLVVAATASAARLGCHRHPRSRPGDLEALRLQAEGRRPGQRPHLSLPSDAERRHREQPRLRPARSLP